MKKWLVLPVMLLALLPVSSGEGADMPVDAFIQRAGIEADADLREKIEGFLGERGITAQMLDLMDDARLTRYAEHLSEDLPIAYPELLDGPSRPLPDGAKILRLAVLVPQGAATQSLLADFERGRIYYDENFPVPTDVCRAQCAAVLSDADGALLLQRLNGLPLGDQTGEITGTDFGAIRLAVQWDGGVTRCAAAGDGITEAFSNTIQALLDAGRAAAQGDHS